MSRGELTGKFSKAGDLGLVGPGLLSGGADDMNGAITATWRCWPWPAWRSPGPPD